MKKRFVSVLLVAAMLLSLLAVTTAAANEVSSSGESYVENSQVGIITSIEIPDINFKPIEPIKPFEIPDFKDVIIGTYYYSAVMWAVDKKITVGTTATTFEPEAPCSRAQVVTFLWRAAGQPEPKTTVSPFNDVKDSSQYYYKAVLWAVENKITVGTTATTFEPNASCTRGQVVTFLWRYKGQPSSSATVSFTDVNSAEYYYKAVKWAVEKTITTGTTATTFEPEATCTRGQIVTFLYRAVA